MCCIVSCSPFAAKLGIGPRDAPHQSQGVELSRTTSLRHYGAIKNAESADVEDHQLWSAVSSSCLVPLNHMLLEATCSTSPERHRIARTYADATQPTELLNARRSTDCDTMGRSKA